MEIIKNTKHALADRETHCSGLIGKHTAQPLGDFICKIGHAAVHLAFVGREGREKGTVFVCMNGMVCGRSVWHWSCASVQR